MEADLTRSSSGLDLKRFDNVRPFYGHSVETNDVK